MTDSQSTAPQHDGLGFGCAGLYRLPGRDTRRAVLEFAYDLGIRHFDVSPMYGLGLAEAELADFVGNRRDVRVATKFGIRPTAVGRLAGLVQPPIRQILKMSPALESKVKTSGNAPESGVVGRLLYSRQGNSVAAAKRALVSSLRTLRCERIDYFLLHEPAGAPAEDYSDLVEYLESEHRRGTIGYWGPAGDLSRMNNSLADLCTRAPALQFPYDLIDGYGGPHSEPGQHSITFGFLSRTLPRVRNTLCREPDVQQRCSELLDADLSDARIVLNLLVRDAVMHNQRGTVLLTSTRTKNLEMTYAAAGVALHNEGQVASMIRDKCIRAGAQP